MNVFEITNPKPYSSISPLLMDLLVRTYKYAVYQRCDHLKDWMFIRAEWETASLRLSSLSPTLHFLQNDVFKSQSNIFIICLRWRSSDSYTLKVSHRTLKDYLALCCITLAWTPHKYCNMKQVLLNLKNRSVACLSPSLSTFIHFTSGPNLSTVDLWFPVRPHWLQDQTGTWMFVVIYSKWLAQNLIFSHLMPHCRALSHQLVG